MSTSFHTKNGVLKVKFVKKNGQQASYRITKPTKKTTKEQDNQARAMYRGASWHLEEALDEHRKKCIELQAVKKRLNREKDAFDLEKITKRKDDLQRMPPQLLEEQLEEPAQELGELGSDTV